jgi:hypothetical protein
MAEEHTKNARPSTREGHEEGRARTKRDQKGEKADKRRKHPPRKRQRPQNEGKGE